MILILQAIIILGLLLILAELFIGIEAGFDLVLIGSILIIGGFSGIITNNLAVALIVSTILAVAYIMFGRKTIRQKLIVRTHKTNIDNLIDKTGVVVKSITPDVAGIVKLDDETWRARSDEVLLEKVKIKVKSIEGVTLIVSKL